MQKYLTLILISLIGLTQTGYAETKGSIEILNSKLTRIEQEHKDFTLFFEIECQHSGLKDAILAFVMVPLNNDLEMVMDTSGEPLMSSETFRMLDNAGIGSFEVSIPLSYFPKNANEYCYSCIIFDDETLETMSDTGPLTFTVKEVRNLMERAAANQALDFLEFLFGGSGTSGNGDEDRDIYRCAICLGSGNCIICGGDGVYDDEKCKKCFGRGKCKACDGKGTM